MFSIKKDKMLLTRLKNSSIVKYWHLDVTDEAMVERVFKEIVDEWSKIDVLVNNAGVSGVNFG